MQVFTNTNEPRIAELLQAGAVGVIRTDTLYGIVGRADDYATVERIYAIKERAEHKSPIVLISLTTQLYDEPNKMLQTVLNQVWPGKVSIIIPSQNAPQWISRGNKSVAYRLPDDHMLRSLVEQTGPLIAPSANPEGATPAATITQAQAYFGDAIDFYVDGGAVETHEPSQLIRMKNDGTIERLR